MLHNNYIFHIFETRDEAETGSAGEQPDRNSLAKINRYDFVKNLNIIRMFFFCLFSLICLRKLKYIFYLMFVFRWSCTKDYTSFEKVKENQSFISLGIDNNSEIFSILIEDKTLSWAWFRFYFGKVNSKYKLIYIESGI